MSTGPRVETYLAETYLPRTSAGGPRAAAARARAAARQMRREGAPVRFLRSFFLPEDELWFCFYEARSAGEVEEASRRAKLVLGRIQRAVDVEISTSDKPAATSGQQRAERRP